MILSIWLFHIPIFGYIGPHSWSLSSSPASLRITWNALAFAVDGTFGLVAPSLFGQSFLKRPLPHLKKASLLPVHSPTWWLAFPHLKQVTSLEHFPMCFLLHLSHQFCSLLSPYLLFLVQTSGTYFSFWILKTPQTTSSRQLQPCWRFFPWSCPQQTWQPK